MSLFSFLQVEYNGVQDCGWDKQTDRFIGKGITMIFNREIFPPYSQYMKNK